MDSSPEDSESSLFKLLDEMMLYDVNPEACSYILDKYLQISTNYEFIETMLFWSFEYDHVDMFDTILCYSKSKDWFLKIINGDYCFWHQAVYKSSHLISQQFLDCLLDVPQVDPWKEDSKGSLPIECIAKDDYKACEKFETLLLAMKPKFEERIGRIKSLFVETVQGNLLEFVLCFKSNEIIFDWQVYYKAFAENCHLCNSEIWEHLLSMVHSNLGRNVIITDLEHDEELKKFGSPLDIVFEKRKSEISFVKKLLDQGYECWIPKRNFDTISFNVICEDSVDHSLYQTILEKLLLWETRNMPRHSAKLFKFFLKRKHQDLFWGKKTNLLTIALTTHCGRLAEMVAAECPIVDQSHFANNFFYSRHTERVLKRLLEIHELNVYFLATSVDSFREIYSPIDPNEVTQRGCFYRTYLIPNANSIYEKDLQSFHCFCDWLEEFVSKPPTLLQLTLNHLYRQIKTVRGKGKLQAVYDKRRTFLQANIPKSSFDYIFFKFD